MFFFGFRVLTLLPAKSSPFDKYDPTHGHREDFFQGVAKMIFPGGAKRWQNFISPTPKLRKKHVST